MAVDYRKEIWDLSKRIREDIYAIVLLNDSRINIPFYYDEDDMDDDIQTLIDEEYDIRPGVGCNLNVETLNYCSYIKDIEVVAIQIYKGDVELVDKTSHTHLLSDVTKLNDLAEIYERITQ